MKICLLYVSSPLLLVGILGVSPQDLDRNGLQSSVNLISPTSITLSQRAEAVERDFTANQALGSTETNSKRSQYTESGLGVFVNQPDDPSIPDDDYFRFGASNIAESLQSLFYTEWTLEARDQPEWQELGEWQFFGKQFLRTYNFECTENMPTCHNAPSLSELSKIYPNNRPLVRMIHFTVLKFVALHDLLWAAERVLDGTYGELVSFLPELITYFTLQADPVKKRECEILKKGLRKGMEMGLSILSQVIGTFPNPVTVVIGKQFVESIKISLDGLKLDFLKALTEPSTYADLGTKVAANPWKAGSFKDPDPEASKENPWRKPRVVDMDLTTSVWTNMHQNTKDMMADWQADKRNIFQMDHGKSISLMCGAWEGETLDRNPQNMDKLRRFLHDQFKDLKAFQKKKFHELYWGSTTQAGKPSMMASMMISHQWEGGKDAIKEHIRNLDPYESTILKAVFSQVISTVVSSDGGYMKCTHRDDAPKLCMKAQQAKRGHYATLFCPRPETEPELICQTARWYFDEYWGHEVVLPALSNYDLFPHRSLNITKLSVLSEAYENYAENGNTPSQEITLSGAGFRMAICQNDHVKITDYGGGPKGRVLPHERPARQWAFPAHCGDYRSNQTRAFMSVANLGLDSQAYADTDFGREKLSGQLYRDRIPRSLEGLEPFSHYAAMGAVGIQFPLEKLTKPYPKNLPHNYHRVFTGIDEEFPMIMQATVNFSAWQSNFWFCAGKPNHSVFERERDYMETTDFPLQHYKSHKRRCAKWRKQNAVEIKAYERGERW